MSMVSMAASSAQEKTLRRLYDHSLGPFLDSQEAARRATLAKAAGLALLFGAAAIPALMVFGPPVALLSAIIGALLAHVVVDRFKTRVKHRVMDELCGLFRLTYQAGPDTGLVDDFDALHLVPDHDRRETEDGIRGCQRGVDLDIVEARLVRRGHGKDDSDSTVFQGLLAKLSFHKTFSGRTILSRDAGVFNLIKGWTTPGERVRLEDPLFERAFQVFSTDQIEARYLLTPGLMERLVKLSDRYGGRVQLAFDRDTLLIAIDDREDRFEIGSILRPSLARPARVFSMADEIEAVLGLIDQLGMDRQTRA